MMRIARRGEEEDEEEEDSNYRHKMRAFDCQ